MPRSGSRPAATARLGHGSMVVDAVVAHGTLVVAEEEARPAATSGEQQRNQDGCIIDHRLQTPRQSAQEPCRSPRIIHPPS